MMLSDDKDIDAVATYVSGGFKGTAQQHLLLVQVVMVMMVKVWKQLLQISEIMMIH